MLDTDTGTPREPAAMRLRDLCSKYDIRFKKALGQNLLLDDNINRIMVDVAGLSAGDDVLEIGAGLGALTRRLAQQAGRVLSVEIDASFIPCLEEQFGALDHVHVFRGDILNHPPGKLLEEYIPGGTSHKVVANLPYYITTPILFHLLESEVFFSRIVVMMQAEVGQRLVAPVGSEDYGVLTLAAQWHAGVDLVHRVPASCFVPRPKVDSCIVRFRCRETPLIPGVDAGFLMKVMRAAFQKRRKTLRNSLSKSSSFGAPREAVLEAFEAADIDAGRRPQTLELAEFARLAAEIRARL